MLTRLRSISASEGAVCGDEALDKILTVSGGDMRKAVTTLQSVHNFYGDKADAEAVVEVSGTLPDDCIVALTAAIRSNQFDRVDTEVRNLVLEGYPAATLLQRLHTETVDAADIADDKKAAICVKIAEAEHKLVDGADDLLQLLDVSALMQREVCW